jgi:putative membrane protein
MRNLITIINLCIIIGITTILTQSDKIDRGRNAQTENKTSPYKRDVTTNTERSSAEKSGFIGSKSATVAEYLQQLTDGRLMDLEEGKIAQQRSTTKQLKAYGTLMVKDQTNMLDDLKQIAERKRVALPVGLSGEKEEELSDLKSVHGEAFDKKFVKMMIIDHKRDIRLLEKASLTGDADMQVFATKYLPVVQSHLDKIKALKKKH